MGDEQTNLKVLLRARHLQEHRSFCRAYKRAARLVDPALEAGCPSKATFYRWLAGDLVTLPHPRHCQVLEAMFPGVAAVDLFVPWDMAAPVPGTTSAASPMVPGGYADLAAAFASRAEFAEHMPPHTLFDRATRIQAVGLSLNLLCQHYSDHRLQALVSRGATIHALFLDPDGAAIRDRELEEGHGIGDLANLTRLNIHMLRRLRMALPEDERQRVALRTYDQPLRFNITLIDGVRCVAQPYLPAARGVDSPTFVMQRRADGTGMFDTFARVFDTLWRCGVDCA